MVNNKKEASPVQAGTLGETASKKQTNYTTKALLSQATTDSSAEAQRKRIMEYLVRHGSTDTIEARRDLDVLHPAGRIQELRKAGVPIETIWTTVITEAGKAHRVAKYVLTLQVCEVTAHE